MSKIAQELRTQPETWLRAADLAAAQSGWFPASGERVVVFGCGTSFYMAEVVARFREQAGQGETDAFPASELPLGRHYDVYVAISRSGTTTEVLDVIARLDGRRVLAVTADAASPVGRRATSVIELGFADEESVVQTRFATTCVALWRAHLGHDLSALAAQAQEALTATLPATLLETRQFVFLGRHVGAAFASEAALKMREAAGAWTEAYTAMEFRHGPVSAVKPDSVVWSLDQLEAGLRSDIRATKACLVESTFDPMVELIRVQRAAVDLASARGLDPDHPRHLSRSVVLTSADMPG